jgi:tetratricopeptide (TPR) repeat protein
MSSILILRDATLAINGAPERRAAPRTHLEERVEVVAGYDTATIEACIATLMPAGGGEDSDPEVLEALFLVGLAHPVIAEAQGVNALVAGRSLAARAERAGDVERALAALDLLVRAFPGNKVLERDLAALMRRQGMVQDLVARYMERANGLLRAGRTEEAVPWLREVMLIDRSRKDVARLIRDLRFRQTARVRGEKRRYAGLVAVALAIGLLAGVVLRERKLSDSFAALSEVVEGDLESMRSRLADLEDFVDQHPVWHGSLAVLEERSRLRVAIERLAEQEALAREARSQEDHNRSEEADLARRRGVLYFDRGDFARALDEFQTALELAAANWPERERAARDIDAIERFLEERP